jgi:hypothetical protein
MIACQHVYICHSRRRKTAAKVQHAQLLVTRPARTASRSQSFGPRLKERIIAGGQGLHLAANAKHLLEMKLVLPASTCLGDVCHCPDDQS